MYFKFIKFVVLLSLLVCCRFAGRVLYSCLFNLAVQGKEPRHTYSHGNLLITPLRNQAAQIFYFQISSYSFDTLGK